MTTLDSFTVKQEEGFSVIRLIGPVILDSECEFTHALTDWLNSQPDPQDVVVNFQSMTACSSSVIGALIFLSQRLKQHHKRMLLCNMSDELQTKFRILYLEPAIFEIHESLDDAVLTLHES